MEKKKWVEYAIKIRSALNESIGDELSDNYIDPKELDDEDNLTQFIHALANVVPSNICSELTGDNSIDCLGFNHIANRLCVQYRNKENKQ